VDALLTYLLDPAHWEGTTGIPNRLVEHLILSLLAAVTAAVIALPMGLYMGHTGRFTLLGINLANFGRAVPSYAVMVMILPVALALAPRIGYDPRLGLIFIPIFGAMVLLAIPPILVGAYAGLREVDRELLEASRGMGLTEAQILARVELPLASPVMAGGFRTALLQVIATATIGAILSGGGIGRFIIDGIARRDDGSIYAGVVLVAALAIGVDLGMAALQRVLTPRGVRVATAAERPGGGEPQLRGGAA
jgi:osmoprotectant transport system permease protein